MNSKVIYPEMNQKTDAQIEFTIGYAGKFRLKTKETLKGRGITLDSDGTTNKRGMATYYATQKAMDKLKTKYTTCYIASL